MNFKQYWVMNENKRNKKINVKMVPALATDQIRCRKFWPSARIEALDRISNL